MRVVRTVLLAILLFASLVPASPASATTAVLGGKTALFAGDSITYGYMDSSPAPRSWALRLRDKYHMIVTNNGHNGHSLSDVRDYTVYGGADKRLHAQCFDTSVYDYVILQGGVNDIIGAENDKGHPCPGVAVAVGSVASTKNPADFDTTTFAGGLERYFYEATTRYPSARIGFIITYQTPNSTWGGKTRSADAYWSIAREICDKWNIPYLDLYDKRYSDDLLMTTTNTYLSDTLHLNEHGYDVVSAVLADWMATLPRYGDQSGKTIDHTGEALPSTIVESTSVTQNAPKTTTNTDTVTTTSFRMSTTSINTARTSSNTSTTRSANDADKSDYTWLIVVLAIGAVAVMSVVVVAAVRERL